MNFIRQLGFLRLGTAAPASLEEDGRVLNLFRNRAELKKAYGDVQNEIHSLRDRVKQQEGATARVQQMLETLEGRLAEPLGGQQALVFYQLRDLWKSGSELVRGLIAELAGQHEDRERRLFLSDFNRRQFEQRQEVEHGLNIAQIAAADVRAKLTELQKAHKAASRWWHYFKRRDLERRIQAMTAEAQGTRDGLVQARAAYDAVINLQPPEFPGLSIDARRAINVTAIAYAEVLAQRLVRTPLLQMAAEAWRRRDSGTAYPDVATCTALMTQIARAKLALAGRGTASVEVKQRSEQLRLKAKYRSSAEVVPTEESVAVAAEPALAAAFTGQAPQPALPQVLREDHWDLRRLLLR
jgi:hypothetical protein